MCPIGPIRVDTPEAGTLPGDTIAPRAPIRGQPARRSLPEFQTTGRSREDDDEYEND
jgi:hypothetical protein